MPSFVPISQPAPKVTVKLGTVLQKVQDKNDLLQEQFNELEEKVVELQRDVSFFLSQGFYYGAESNDSIEIGTTNKSVRRFSFCSPSLTAVFLVVHSIYCDAIRTQAKMRR